MTDASELPYATLSLELIVPVGPLNGPRISPRSGPRLGPAGGMLVDLLSSVAPGVWSTDATSGIAVPASIDEWTDFIVDKGLSVAVPDYLHLCQESSGPLADSIGTLTLTDQNMGTGFSRTVTGWSRKGVFPPNQAAACGFINTTSPNFSTTSVAILCYIFINQVDANSREIFGVGGPSDTTMQAFSTDAGVTGYIRYREGSNIGQDTHADYVNGPVVPVLMVIDHTGSRARWYSTRHRTTATYGVPSTATNYFLGTQGATWADSTIVYSCGWTGADAEISDANAKALLQALGWTVDWSV